MFHDLATSATNDGDRELARELERLAIEWRDRRYVLVPTSEQGETTLLAKSQGRRTNDEIVALYGSSVLYGIGSGAWLATLTKPSSAAGGILPALALAGASAGAVAALDSGKGLAYGVPQSIVSGLDIGFEEGLAFTLWNQARATRADEWEGSTIASVMWGFSTAGAIAGGVIGGATKTTPGRASFVGSTALWSGIVTGLVAGAASPDDERADDRAFLVAALGLNAGAIAGAVLASDVSPSIARVRFLDLGALSGALVFGGVYLAAADKNVDTRAALGVTAAGIATGFGVAWLATASMPEDRLARNDDAPSPGSVVASIRPTLTAMPGGVGLGAAGTLF